MKNLKTENGATKFIPAAEILPEAEAKEPEFGHSPAGFLSRKWGFLPVNPPLTAMPQTHHAWDEAVASLPELIATQRVIEILNDLPNLSAHTQDLADSYLWRASLVLGYLAHAYVHSAENITAPPPSIAHPWAEVNRRLGRPHSGLTLADYSCYNWRLEDENKPRQVENMDVIVAWFGNQEERFNMGGFTEMNALSGTLVDATANLQTAILQNKVDQVKVALLRILDFLRDITFKSLLKMDPNPYSQTCIDPLIWTKAFITYSSPINDHERGLGGAGTSIIQLLDALFERGVYSTEISHETLEFKEWLPLLHHQFIESISQVSLLDFMEKVNDQELDGLVNSVFDAYVGKRGFLGVHRLKVYGFMEIGFKAGRTQTNSGYTAETEARGWEELDDTLEATRQDRFAERSPRSLRIRRKSVTQAAINQNSPVNQVVLDTEHQGLQYEAGDRLGIFPQNSPDLIQKTLLALDAQGDEPIRLTNGWREVLGVILHETPETIPLKQFLAYAKIRPLLRSVGKALLHLTRSQPLYDLLEKRQEDQIELWDAFEMLASENYDVRRFWKAAPWEAESIARLVPPEHFRIYSISSAPNINSATFSPPELHLTVGRLSFENNVRSQEAVVRQGTASGYLVQEAAEPRQMPVQIVRPSRFHLPDDVERPVVMFAGGTGVSPFRGFMQQRATAQKCGPNWLFLGTRTFDDLPYEQALNHWVARDQLNLRAAFSREEKKLVHTQGKFELTSGPRGYVDQLFEDKEDAKVLWQYLQSKEDGGLEGYFYICGQARFAHTVIEGIKKLIAHHLPDTTSNKTETANLHFRKLMAQGRFMLDVFTTFAPSAAASVFGFENYDASELIEHNNEGQGYWTVIQGNVYDMTEFKALHPGGERLLIATAGLDCTRSYEKTEHHLNSEVHALLDLYKIGTIRRLDFKDQWNIAIKPKSLVNTSATNQRNAGAIISLSLHGFYRHWIRYVYDVVEIENSLNNNFSMRQRPIVKGDALDTLSKAKAQLLLDSHDVFYNDHVDSMLGDSLEMLWNIALGFCDHNKSITELPQAIAKVRASSQAATATAYIANVNAELTQLAPTPTDDPARWTEFDQQLLHIEHCDKIFIAAVKAVLQDGLRAFEKYEDQVVVQGGDQLVEALQRIPTQLENYYLHLIRND